MNVRREHEHLHWPLLVSLSLPPFLFFSLIQCLAHLAAFALIPLFPALCLCSHLYMHILHVSPILLSVSYSSSGPQSTSSKDRCGAALDLLPPRDLH
ncbi:hypothetical protein LI328DRAFT_102835 [Trichoderma asperelloides]|nr:hypothetical protein LI328DRAFT_102835 [Trichoderma asperelloides]